MCTVVVESDAVESVMRARVPNAQCRVDRDFAGSSTSFSLVSAEEHKSTQDARVPAAARALPVLGSRSDVSPPLSFSSVAEDRSWPPTRCESERVRDPMFCLVCLSSFSSLHCLSVVRCLTYTWPVSRLRFP